MGLLGNLLFGSSKNLTKAEYDQKIAEWELQLAKDQKRLACKWPGVTNDTIKWDKAKIAELKAQRKLAQN